MKEVRRKAIRGGMAKLCGQGVLLGLRLLFLVVMARLLDPADFGIVAMVTVVTGIYELFATAGLSAATVQRATITDEQLSSLFWVNLLVGVALGVLCLVTAPILVAFYHEPRLTWIAAALAVGFVVAGAGVQHMALLQRQMRYGLLAAIEILANVASIAVGLLLAFFGFGYWALVATSVVLRAVMTLSVWLATSWMPGRPHSAPEIHALLRFGATITANNFVIYTGYNFEKALVGRVWGADALGLYGRAFQIVDIPSANLMSAVGGVAFSALSRIQDDPARIKRYFLKGYSILNAMTIPTTMFCAMFAEEIILVVLGPKWVEATTIYRVLTPTILVFGMINPTGWLLQSTGLQMRSLQIALVVAPVVIMACIIGLPYGANGVACGFSAAMVLLLIPQLTWALHKTAVSVRDVFLAVWRPFVAGTVAAAVAFAIAGFLKQEPLVHLIIGGGVMTLCYAWLLMFVLGQRDFYLSLFRELTTAQGSI